MGFSKIKFIFILFGLSLIVGCSSSEPPVSDAEGAGIDGAPAEDATGLTSASGRNITFLSLSILETSSEYSGYGEDDVYVTERFFPFIHGILLSTFDAKTLEVEVATIDDFVITEDGQVVDSLESFPILQKVGAIPTYLHTAIVLDVSGSVTDTVGLNEIVSEAKELIKTIQESSDPVIANQRFTVWAFAQKITELTSGFTADKTVLDAALDQVLTVELGSSSNLNQAIVEAIGRFDGNGGEGAGPEPFLFRDTGDTNNDLIETVSTERIQLSSLILITSGSDTLHVFDDEQVKTAIESQSQVVFAANTGEAEEAKESVTENFGKPFVVVLVGNDSITSASITDNASNIINLKGQAGDTLSFAASTADFQANLIGLRKRQDARYFLRYASPLRQGSHERVIATGAVDYQYSLTAPIEIGDIQNWGMPSEVYLPPTITSVEITTENNQYLQNFININDISVFHPATRWTNSVFASSDYTWVLDGTTLPSNEATGAVTINKDAIDDISVLSLTNTAIGETRSIQITSSLTSLLLVYDGSSGFPLTGQTVSRDTIAYKDLNASEPVDLDNPVAPEYVFQIDHQDYNVPFENYAYSIDVPDMIEQDVNDDALEYDYRSVPNGFQIKKASIDDLAGPIIITVSNTALGTSTSFTLTP